MAWRDRPLEVVSSLFEAHMAQPGADATAFHPTAYFDKLLTPDSLRGIPSLNDNHIQEIAPGALVQFRCMIQDTFDPEMYLDVYEEVAPDGSRRVQSGKFRDRANTVVGGKIDEDSSNTRFGKRCTLHCIPIPGETAWVSEALRGPLARDAIPAARRDKAKRGRDNDDSDGHGDVALAPEQTLHPAAGEPSLEVDAADGMDAADDAPTAGTDVGKRAKLEGQPEAPAAGTGMWRADPTHPVLVKILGDVDFRVNEVLHVVGIYVYDRADHDMLSSNDFSHGFPEEYNAKHPPASLVPRLHCVAYRALPSINPRVPKELTPAVWADFETKGPKCADHLRAVLCSLLGGDELATEYILLYLISAVHERVGERILGRCNLNVHGFRDEMAPAVASILEVVQAVTSKCVPMPLTLEHLNMTRFVPSKNPLSNRLEHGVLQLPRRTRLVIDETVMSTGQLERTGYKNLEALQILLSKQAVNYEFPFSVEAESCQTIAFPTEVAGLVLSDGKSLLVTDFRVKLAPSLVPAAVELPDDVLADLRAWVELCHDAPFQISKDITDGIVNDFVEARQKDSQYWTPECLNDHLTLARLVAISMGLSDISGDVWLRTKRLEAERRARIAAEA